MEQNYTELQEILKDSTKQKLEWEACLREGSYEASLLKYQQLYKEAFRSLPTSLPFITPPIVPTLTPTLDPRGINSHEENSPQMSTTTGPHRGYGLC